MTCPDHVRDTMTQSSVHTAGICLSFSLSMLVSSYPFFFSPSLRYNITHSSNDNFYPGITHLKKKNYFQFYPSRNALVIKTNAFTIIINLNPIFTNPNIYWQRDRVIWTSDLLTVPSFLFSFCCWFVLVFLLFFFFLLRMVQFLLLSFSFLFFSRRSIPFPSFCCWFVLFFSFFFSSFHSACYSSFLCSFFSVIFVDAVLWCLRLSFTVTRFVLSPCRDSAGTAPNRSNMLYTHMHIHMHIHAE